MKLNMDLKKLLLNIICLVVSVMCDEKDNLSLFVKSAEGSDELKLTCIYSGRNINSSIIWNGYDIGHTTKVNDFQTTSPGIDCDISKSENCTKDWIGNKYKLENSLDHRFGIVYDYRVDEFERISATSKTFNVTKTRQIPISLINYNNQTTLEIEVNGTFRTVDEIRECISYEKKWNDILIKANTTSVTFYCNNVSVAHNETEINKLRINRNGNVLIIHNYTFAHTTTMNKVQNLGPSITLHNETLCVSMFIAMCKTCKLDLALIAKNATATVVHRETYRNNHERWKKIKFTTTERFTGGFHLQFKPIGHNRFLAIDYVQRCSFIDVGSSNISVKKEHVSENYCSLGKSINSLRINYKNITTKKESFNCQQFSFDKNCLDCLHLFGNYDTCDQNVECYQTDGQETTCNCRSGYFVSNGFCNKCGKGFYGDNCKEKCNHCNENSCHHIIGNCCDHGIDSCKANISCSGDLYSAKISSKNYTETAIQINKTKPSNRSFKFHVEYKKNGTDKWNSTRSHLLTDTKFVNISDLETNTLYNVRVITYGANDCKLEGPTETFKTKCPWPTTILRENSIDFKVSSSHCSPETCSATLKNSSGHIIHKGTLKKLVGLYSATDYELYLINCTDIEFDSIKLKTLPKALNVVENVNVIATENGFNISWATPKHAEGIIDYYLVEYQQIKHIACDQNAYAQNAFVNVTGQICNLRNIEPYSEYLINITAFNGKFGKTFTNIYRTLAGALTDEDFSAITLEEIDNSTIIVKYDLPCSKINGSMSCEIEMKSSVATQKQSCDLIKRSVQCKFNGIPFANHSLSFNCSRSEKRFEKHIETKPAAPGPIQNLTVYLKGNNYMSIKWQAPQPANGIIDRYGYKIDSRTKTLRPPFKDCLPWKNFYCHNITDLPKTKNVKIEFYAYNINVAKPSMKIITATKDPEPPTEPLNLNFTYDDSNNVVLTWSHPDLPNAVLSEYRIYLSNNVSHLPYIMQPNYNYTILEQSIEPEKLHNLTVAAVAANGVEGKRASIEIYVRPKKPNVPTNVRFIRNENDQPMVTIPCEHVEGYVYVIVRPINENTTMDTNNDDCTILDVASNEWIAEEFDNCSSTIELVLGTITKGRSSKRQSSLLIENRKLPEEFYVDVVFLKEFGAKKRCSHVSLNVPMSESSSITYIIGVLIVIVIIVIVVVSIWKIKCNCNINVIKKGEEEIPLQEKSASVPIYYEIAKQLYEPIAATEFGGYVERNQRDNEFPKQFNLLQKGPTKSTKIALLDENRSKNRYKDLVAYDDTRVILQNDPASSSDSDYINANRIKGYDGSYTYIATQGPKPTTVNDFWRMIWQEKVAYIVMLTNIFENDVRKCTKYWSECEDIYDGIKVTFEGSCTYAHYEKRIFAVEKMGESRNVVQFHFLSWPDHSVPPSAQSLLTLVKVLLRLPQNSPIVVHCSAGVGRTGAIILCDICLRMLINENKVDVLCHFAKLREQRMNMVNNIDQYQLVHMIIYEYLLHRECAITESEDECIEKRIEMMLENDIDRQMDSVEKSLWIDEQLQGMANNRKEMEMLRHYATKEAKTEPELQEATDRERDISDMEAVRVEGLFTRDKFIVMPQPSPKTTNNFWRSIRDENVDVVVSLNEIDRTKETSWYFWPTVRGDTFDVGPYLKLELSAIDDASDSFSLYTLLLRAENEVNEIDSKRTVRLVQMKHWFDEYFKPEEVRHLLDVWEVSEKYSSGCRPTVVTCFNGTRASGLFVAASLAIGLMSEEKVCDVCWAVRTVKQANREFVYCKSQFAYLYEVILQYLNAYSQRNDVMF